MSTIFNRKPIIGVTTWRRDLPTFLGEATDLYTLGPEYIDWVEKAGGVPVLFPHGISHVSQYLELIDALLVTGGGDVDPDSYGQKNEGLSYDVNPGADLFEIRLVQEAAKRKLPTFGVCRGFQIMQVAFGGDMLQDLHAEYPEHPESSGAAEYILSLRHKVHFSPNSFLFHAYNGSEIVVNTIHHQCVRSLGKGFKAAGWSEDGLIEAAESGTDWLAVGVQWHPEKINDTLLFRRFIEEMKNYSRKVIP